MVYKPSLKTPIGRGLGLCLAFVLTLGLVVHPVAAQDSWLDRPDFIQAPITQINELEIGTIYLDGSPVVSITAPRPPSDDDNTPDLSPIKERVELVHRQLKAIAENTLANSTITVDYDYDVNSSTVSINSQYLMTLTEQDAQAYGMNLSTYSSFVRSSVTEALEDFHRERQPNNRQQQLFTLLGSLLGGALLLWGFKIAQKKTSHWRKKSLSRYDLDRFDPLEAKNEAELSEAEQARIVAHEQEYKRQRDAVGQINFKADLALTIFRFLSVCLVVGILAFSFYLFPESRWISSLVLNNLVLTLAKVVGLILGSYILIRLCLLGIDYGYSLLIAGQRLSSKNAVRSLLRLQTLRNYSHSVVIFFLTAIALLGGLRIIGLDLAPLIAGAGILGIAISFGAQNLIKDMINGLFILWEDQYGIGDVISVNGATGLVESMNLRMTQLRSPDGDLISIPNGSIELVKNHSNHWSRANLGIEVAYDTDLEKAMSIIKRTAVALRFDPRWGADILEDPQVLGVDAFGDNSITIRLWIKTKPLRQWDVSREFRHRIKLAFDQANISIPFPQRTLWLKNSPDVATPPRELDPDLE